MTSFLAKAIVILILFAGIGFLYADSAVPTPVGKVVWIKGDSLKAMMPNKEERQLQKQSVVYLNDVLSTNADTTAEIVFTDNTLITFKPDTTFSIDEYRYGSKKEGNSVGKSVMKLIKGGFRTITGLIAKSNPDDYEMKTPVATIGVRGTDYAVYIENGELFMNHYAGSPCLTNEKGKRCLDPNHRYARVADRNTLPEFLDTQPAGFREKLEITDASFTPFSPEPKPNVSKSSSDKVNSFCIQ